MANRTVFCHDCGQELTEPPPQSGLQPERVPCPNCSSSAREYRATLSTEISVNASIQGVVSEAVTSTGAGRVSIEEAVSTGLFTRKVVWSKTPDAWLAEVRDDGGSLVALEINFDAMDTLVLLAEHLLPPGE